MALAFALVLAPGCAKSPPGASTLPAPAAKEPARTQTPAPTSVERREFAFGSAEGLVTSNGNIEWVDVLFIDDRFSVLSGDDGNGSWAYLDETTKCELYFYQGGMSGLDMTKDDRTISDEMLATVAFQEKPTPHDLAVIGANAFEDTIELIHDGGDVAVRVIEAGDEKQSIALMTRVIGALGEGLLLTVRCPSGQSADDEYSTLARSFLRLAVKQ